MTSVLLHPCSPSPTARNYQLHTQESVFFVLTLNVHSFPLREHLEHVTDVSSGSAPSSFFDLEAASQATRERRHSSQLENWVRRVTSSPELFIVP